MDTQVINKKILPGLLITTVVLLVVSIFFIFQYIQLKKQLAQTPAATQKAAADEAKQVIAAVSKLMLLPTGESPTLATIADITKLADQPFFHNARNGDKVLIYTNAKEAIIYDPTTHIIVNVGTIVLQNQPTPQLTGEPSLSPTPTPVKK